MNETKQNQDLVFCGGCGAAEYVRAVEERSSMEGRQNDYRWMANFAASSLGGAAKVWYDELPEEYRMDWSLLRQALFNQFQPALSPPGSPTARTEKTSLSLPPETIKRPLSPMLDQSYVTGRVRVISPNYKGYISRFPHPEGMARCQVTSRAVDALKVRYLPMDGPHNLEVEDRSLPYQTFLGATWYLQKDPKFALGSSNHADLRLLSPQTPKRGWDDFKKWVFYGNGSTRTSIWHVGHNGRISAAWVAEDGQRHKLSVVGYYKSDRGEVMLVTNKDVFLRANPGHEEARLVLEPL